MISGIGIDSIEVDRVEKKITKQSGFREYVFSENEIKYCESLPNRYEHYAARFAAKEAFLKALGTGWTNEVTFNEIEILDQPNGKPELTVIGKTAANIFSLAGMKIFVSVTHLKKIATAVVVIES
jgi:holo-[acyl-carrier protein] synthase